VPGAYTAHGLYRRLLRAPRTPDEANDYAYLKAIEDMVLSLRLSPPGSPLVESRKEANAWTLAGGVYPGFEHTADHNVIRGLVASSTLSRRCRIEGHASVSGVTFDDDGDLGTPELVSVGPGCAVSFVNCVFRRGDGSVDSIVRTAAAGAGVVAAVASFVGCTFIGGGATTINNASGVAAGVQMVGCVNLTGNATLGTVTETGTVKIL